MVARAERPALIVAARDGAIADPRRIGPVESSPGLGELEVALGAIPFVHHVGGSLLHQPRQLGLVEEVLPALANARWDVAEELFHQRPDAVFRLAPLKLGAQQPDAAVDVVADAAGRDDSAFFGVGRRHAADAESISPVDIRHGQAGHLDARQRGHVGHLFGALVLLDLLDQGLVGEDDAVDPHVRAVALRDSPLIWADRLQRPGISALLAHRLRLLTLVRHASRRQERRSGFPA